MTQMRGLCGDTLFDWSYILDGYINQKPEIRGYYYSRLYWKDKSWNLVYLPDQTTNAVMIKSSQGN